MYPSQWLSMSGGNRSREINDISHIGELKAISKEKKSTKMCVMPEGLADQPQMLHGR